MEQHATREITGPSYSQEIPHLL